MQVKPSLKRFYKKYSYVKTNYRMSLKIMPFIKKNKCYIRNCRANTY